MKAAHFVTGATGFVGSNLVLELLGRPDTHIFALLAWPSLCSAKSLNIAKESAMNIERTVIDIIAREQHLDPGTVKADKSLFRHPSFSLGSYINKL